MNRLLEWWRRHRAVSAAMGLVMDAGHMMSAETARRVVAEARGEQVDVPAIADYFPQTDPLPWEVQAQHDGSAA